MDCDALTFHSDLAGWNAVSTATEYDRMLTDPGLVKTIEGDGIDDELFGYLVKDVNTRRLKDWADKDRRRVLSFDQPVALLQNPLTREPARTPDGRLIVLAAPEKRNSPPGMGSMVSWRGDGGVDLHIGGGAGSFLPALRGAFPEVNVIRLDFNAETVDNPGVITEWHDFAQRAAQMGYGLIIQNSDGDLAGGLKRPVMPELGPPDALSTPDAAWKINDVRRDWLHMLDWFNRPENADILNAVVGWELINEPMAYPNTPEGGALHSRHIADLIGAVEWGDKRLLVGGLRASALFKDLDRDLIRQAAGDRLIWSAHMYPSWVTAKAPQTSAAYFCDSIRQRIGTLDQPGDDIIVTESQLYTEAGSLDPATSGKRAARSFNMARQLPWFADNGIGWTWWPPTGRSSSLLQWQGAKGGYRVQIESAAFAHWGWVRDETAVPQDATEHWGSDGAEKLVVADGADPARDHVVSGVSNPHGLIYGLAGDDVLMGGALVDMLYGGDGGDSVSGGAGDDWLFGDRGDDVLDGGDGDDVLIDHEGANTLTGGPGNDHLEGSGTLDGGEGDDVLIAARMGAVLTGGPGADRFLPDMAGQVTITDFAPGQDKLDLTLISAPKRGPVFTIQADGPDANVSFGDLTLHLPGAAGITVSDVTFRPPLRVEVR